MKELEKAVEAILSQVPIDAGGGCSVFKACMLAALIRDGDLKVTADIGVYRGRSLFPQAVAHQLYTGGVVFGIDPWNMGEALQQELPEAAKERVKEWRETVSLQQIYEGVEGLRQAQSLAANCELVRKPSSTAIADFQRDHVFFDLVHIDGNHDRERVTADVENYLPRLRREGFLVLDDISWGSIRGVYDDLKGQLTHIYERVDGENDFAVYWNGKSWPKGQAERLRLLERTLPERAARVKAGLVRRLRRVGAVR